MADKLISQNTAVNAILDLCLHLTQRGSMDEYGASCLCGAAALVKAVPAVDATPVVHARWLIRDRIYRVAYCSNCNFELKISDTKYCPACGARMDGGMKNATN